MELITADKLTYSAFADMIDDYAVAGTPFLGITDPSLFAYFVRTCIKHAAGIGLSAKTSPYTRYFLTDKTGTIFAQGDLRHRETQHNLLFAGQLGYGVPPSHRKCGYGTMICAKLLEKAAARGFSNIIITCRDDNLGSAKIIEKNGGILLNKIYNKEDHIHMRRYKVDLSNYAK
jgi:acetyltransferase, GNAT family